MRMKAADIGVKIASALIYAPFVASLVGGAFLIPAADISLFFMVIFVLLYMVLVFTFASSIMGIYFRYAMFRRAVSAVMAMICMAFIVASVSWSTGGKPGDVLYSGPEQFYHVMNIYLSLSFLIAAALCAIFTSEVEQILRKRIGSVSATRAIYAACLAVMIVSAIIWHGYLTLPVTEIG
ncbi:MAG: hypothetical protein ACK5MQ_04715 [Pikeienuella sp.]